MIATRGQAIRRDLAQREVSPPLEVDRDRLVAHNAIVVVGTLSAGLIGGVVFLGMFSHRLNPADYGAVFTVITLLNLVAVPATALTLMMARETSRDRASGRYAPSTALLRDGNRTLLLLGSALALLVALASQLLSGFLGVPVPLLLAAAAGIPLTVALPLLLGELQGSQQFVAYSVIFAGYAALKLIAAILLGALFGATGVVAGISVGAALAYVWASWILRRKLSMRPRWPWLRPATAYLAFLLPGTIAIAVLLSVDVVLVKHYFPARVAGEYSAVAALGRAIFWGASGVAAVLFPKLIFLETKRVDASHLILGALTLVAGGGLIGLFLLSLTAPRVMAVFAGVAYSAGSGYLAWYALGMTLLGAAAVLIATHQSRGNPAFLAIVLPITALEPALIIAFHASIIQVVLVMDGCMAVLVASLATLTLKERSGDRITLPMLAPESTLSAPVPVPQPIRI